MYDELVKRLRELHPEEFGDAWDFAFACQQAMHEAADAIEELPAYVALYKDSGETAMAVVNDYKARLEELQGKYFVMKKTAEWLAEKVPTWVPITERLPSAHELVLVYNPGYPMTTGFLYEDGRWRVRGVDYPDTPTHWMPLPEPPKEGTC